MKLSELSELTVIRPGTILAMYHGTIKRIELDHVEALCKVLDCESEELFTFEK